MLKRMSLTSKMLVLTLLIGAATWGILDYVQSKSISRIFHDQLTEELALQAQTDRLDFDHFVKTHSEAAKLFASQKRFNDYLDRVEASGWVARTTPPEMFTSTAPPWYPRLSVARAFLQARYALLLGPDGKAREVFQVGPAPPPDGLLYPTALLRQLSHNQSFMTRIGGMPFLIASESLTGAGNKVRATLVLATPLDDEALFTTHSSSQQGRVTALLSGNPKVVIASSRPDLIHDGATLEELSGQYLMAGKSFFDYGASDLRLQFSSFISRDKLAELTGALLKKERSQRAITALALLASFVVIMLWITGNIKLLTKSVTDFSTDVLGLSLGDKSGGDELLVLKDKFTTLTEEVITARAALQKEAEGKVILERQAAEARLKARDIEILMQVMEILGVGVISLGDGGPAALNPVMVKFAEDCGGIANFVPEDGLDTRELSIVDRNGEPRYFNVSRFFSLVGEQGYLLVHDITEGRRAEQTLRESEGRARAITETATDAIILIDSQGKVTYWNPAAQKIFGYASEEVMGMDVHELLTPEKYLPAARKGFEHFAKTGEGPALGITRVLSALKKDGSEFPVELSLSAFESKGKMVAVGVVRDITDRVRDEEDKNALFHMMTHDIKGPLSIIYGYGELLNAQLEEPDKLDMINEMQKAAGRISSLIDDMLALSRIESGKASLKLEEVSLAGLVEQAVLDAELMATEMDVTFEIFVDDAVPAIQADKDQIGRALGNLTVNAVNYNRQGGKVFINAGRSGGEIQDTESVYIEVSDTGIGIPEEDIPRVFEKYFRSKATGSRRGTGLGLAIVKAAVEAHGGSVSVSCEYEKGCTFRVELPVRPQGAMS